MTIDITVFLEGRSGSKARFCDQKNCSIPYTINIAPAAIVALFAKFKISAKINMTPTYWGWLSSTRIYEYVPLYALGQNCRDEKYILTAITD
jgi:hypothetical protein